MLSFIMNLAVGTVMGLLAGMGVGGGSLLLLWLTQVAMLDPEQARLINLLFYLPAAVIASLKNRESAVWNRYTFSGAFAGCIAALIFSLIGRNLEIELLKKLLGALLIATGIRELLYRPRKAK